MNCKFKDVRIGIANADQPGNNASNVTLDTLLRVFTALKAKVKLQVELSDLNFSVGG